MTMNNPIGKLQEIHQRNLDAPWGPPVYHLVDYSGEAHGPTFKIEARFQGLTATAEGASKKQAKSLAAAKLLGLLDGAPVPEVLSVPESNSTGNKVGELQEYCSVNGLLQPWYEEGAPVGPDHSRCFTIVASLGWIRETGEGTTKKTAKRLVSHLVLEKLKSLTEEQRSELKNPDLKKKEYTKEELENDNTKEDSEDIELKEDILPEGSVGVWTGEEIFEAISANAALSRRFNNLDLSVDNREH